MIDSSYSSLRCEWVRYKQPVGAGFRERQPNVLTDNLWFPDQNNGKTRPYKRAIKELISLYLTRLQAPVFSLSLSNDY